MTLWKETKRLVRLCFRTFRDWRSGERRRFARSKTAVKKIEGWHRLSQSQPIRPGETLENKLANIGLASLAIDGLVVQPGEIFSFWDAVGWPSERRGFRRSRNIVQGRLSAEVGGGLCQVSGIVYQLALRAGLEIRERHAHSVDIYKEEERFAPLGADATVVYGYKDLRCANPFPFRIVLRFEISRSELTLHIFSEKTILPKNILFRRKKLGKQEKVETLETLPGGVENLLAVSWYGQL